MDYRQEYLTLQRMYADLLIERNGLLDRVKYLEQDNKVLRTISEMQSSEIVRTLSALGR